MELLSRDGPSIDTLSDETFSRGDLTEYTKKKKKKTKTTRSFPSFKLRIKRVFLRFLGFRKTVCIKIAHDVFSSSSTARSFRSDRSRGKIA